jgi:hypothetical protein
MPKKAQAVKSKAGRPTGTGKYGCPTKVVRVPIHLEEDIQAFVAKKIKAEKK